MTDPVVSAADTWTVEEGDRTEIRIATVMTGGVSLAVWMGGVGYELHQLTDPAGHGGPYQPLCDLLGTTTSVDVIAGSSAGGINGALLALATAHPAPLDFVRELWLEDGALEQLLRPPTEPAPRSLLRGDEHFLPSLRRAFASVPRRSIPARRNLKLLITTTLLQGESRSITDDFGTVIRDVDHHGLFRFGVEDFNHKEIAAQLAKAARCSASFPIAFEASYCRVEPGAGGSSDEDPNMDGIIDTTISRFTVDGGLLKNKPIGPALQAIFEHPPERPVRRVLLYVVPDPGGSTYGEPEKPEAPPTLGRVLLSSLLEIPTAQSIATDLDDLRRHNRRIEQQRHLREELLHTGLSAQQVSADQYRHYRELRARATADEFLEELTRQLNGMVAVGTLPMEWQAAYEFNSEAYRLRRLRLAAAEYRRLPSQFPGADEDAFSQLSGLGSEAIARSAYVALDLAERALELCYSRELRQERGRVLQVSKSLHAMLAGLRQQRGDPSTLKQAIRDSLREVGVNSREELTEWARECFDAWSERPLATNLDRHLREICDHLRTVNEAMRGITRWYEEHPDSAPRTSREQQRRVRAAIEVLAGSSTTDTIARQLLTLEVLQIVLAVDKMVLEQLVELMQLSAESRNGLTYHRAPTEKLTGLQLNHFGAFYKRSWRSNDWLWGRIDAAGWITYLLLQPKRLRQLQDLIDAGDPQEKSREQFLEGLVGQLEAIAIGARGKNVLDQSQQDYLRRLWENDKPALLEELEFLKHPVPQARPLEDPGLQNPEHVPDPTSLPRTSIALARGLQYAILREELPKLRDDMEIDVEQGAGGRGTLSWRVRFDREWNPEAGVRRPETPVALFRDSPLPRERLGDEVGTDMFTYTAATTAATGLKAGTIALPAVPPVLNAPLAAARGIGIVLFFLSRWMLHASKTAFAAVAGAVALGLLLMFSNNGWAKTIGTALVGASAIVILLKAWRRLRVKSSGLFKAAVAVAAVAATLLLLFLLLAPWLPGPAEDAPAKGLRAAGDWLVSHPTAYVAIVSLVVLAVVGSIPLQRRTESRSAVRPLREALEAHARRLQLDLDLFIDPSVTRHLAGHLASVQRAGEALLSAVHSHAGKHVRLQVTGRKSLFQLDAEHDGKRIGELRLTSRRVGRRKIHRVSDTPLTNSLRHSSLRIPLNGDSSFKADRPIETAEPQATQPQG